VPPSSVRYYDVEDQAVAWLDPRTALVFEKLGWITASAQLAQKAMVEGFELSRSEFAHEFAGAAATDLPCWFLTKARQMEDASLNVSDQA
jgi:hypothetical protein